MKTLRNIAIAVLAVGSIYYTFFWPEEESEFYVQIPLDKLYPNRVHGPIADYTLAIPADFKPLDSAFQVDESAPTEFPFFTWGSEGAFVDLEYRKPIYLVGYIPGMYLRSDGYFGNETKILNTEYYNAEDGLTDAKVTYGYFRPQDETSAMVSIVPAMVMTGTQEGHSVCRVHIYSPEDEAVLAVWAMGGEEGTRNLHGKVLVESVNLLEIGGEPF